MRIDAIAEFGRREEMMVEIAVAAALYVICATVAVRLFQCVRRWDEEIREMEYSSGGSKEWHEDR